MFDISSFVWGMIICYLSMGEIYLILLLKMKLTKQQDDRLKEYLPVLNALGLILLPILIIGIVRSVFEEGKK